MPTLKKPDIMEQLQRKGVDFAEIAQVCNKPGLEKEFYEACEAFVCKLYDEDIITSPEACRILGVSRRDFEGGILGKHGFVAYGNDEEDIRREIKGIEALKNYHAER